MIQAKVQAAVEAVCPIDGIGFGKLLDRTTWRIDFKESASAPQRQAAQAVVDAFDIAAAQAAENADAARVAADTVDLGVCAVDPQVTAFLNFSPADLDAWVANNITAAPITLAQLKTNTGIAIQVLGKLALMGARGRKLRNGN